MRGASAGSNRARFFSHSCAGCYTEDMSVLDKEIETYRTHLAELLRYEGKYVLIHEAEVIDTFGDYEDALREGYKQFGLHPFLVKRIAAIEPIIFLSRGCHT
jgi:hypothetical protein